MKMIDKIYATAIDGAKKQFKPENLQIGDLVCSSEAENPRMVYKVFEITGDRVNIALPDMVMVDVSINSLYNASVAEQIGEVLIANVNVQMREIAATQGLTAGTL